MKWVGDYVRLHEGKITTKVNYNIAIIQLILISNAFHDLKILRMTPEDGKQACLHAHTKKYI
jgi:hypothetical protein